MMAGLWCIEYYLNASVFGSVFGTARAVLILLLWIYYTAQVFLFGASFTYAWSVNFGSKKAAQKLKQFKDIKNNSKSLPSEQSEN